MTKQFLILEGSPRKKGNSNTLAAQAAAGAVESGAQVETVYLNSMKISPCNGCDACRKTGVCTVKDEMQTLYPKIIAADALVLASPIYWSTFSAQLKTCIDRWYALWNGKHDLFKTKPVGIILTYGDSDVYTSGAINAIHTFETMFRFLEARIEFVYGSLMDVGDAEKNANLMKQAFEMGKRLVQ